MAKQTIRRSKIVRRKTGGKTGYVKCSKCNGTGRVKKK